MEKQRAFDGKLIINDRELKNCKVHFFLKNGEEKTFVISGSSPSSIGGVNESGKYDEVNNADIIDYQILLMEPEEARAARQRNSDLAFLENTLNIMIKRHGKEIIKDLVERHVF